MPIDFSDLVGAKDILDTNSVSPYIRKMIDTTRSVEEKYEIIKNKTLNKELLMDGYQELVYNILDADSGYYIDENGKRIDVRLADFNPYDAIDQKAKVRDSSAKSRIQPKIVADLVGKNISDLTDEDYNKVYNYQYEQMVGSLSDPNYQFQPFDVNKEYLNPNKDNPAQFKILAKAIGIDKYGRTLIEAVNPTTGRQVSFDASNNPYMNAKFSVYDSLDTQRNRDKLRQYQIKHSNVIEKIADAFDTDSRLDEDVDIIKSSAYQSFARLMNRDIVKKILPEGWVDSKKWAAIANPETGQALADAWAGVKSSTRRDFVKGMLDASKEIEDGNYRKGILSYVTQLDRVFAESATQMGLMAVGNAAVKGLGALAGAGIGAITGSAAPGIGTLGGAIAGFIGGALLAGADETFMALEEYKHNNGKDMPMEDVVKNFFGNVLLLIPDELMATLQLPRLLPKGVRETMQAALKRKPILNRVKLTAASAIFEGTQEMAQDTFNTYFSQNQENAKSISEILDSPEIRQSGIVGALMGGALSGGVGSLTLPFDIKRTKNHTKAVENLDKNLQDKTITGDTADKEVSKQVIDAVNDINVKDFSNVAEITEAVDKLDDILKNQANEKGNIESVEKAKTKKLQIILDAVKEAKKRGTQDILAQALGRTINEVFEEYAQHESTVHSREAFRDNRQLTPEDKAEFEDKLLKTAKDLGIEENNARKLMREAVEAEVKYGPLGYETYNKTLENITEQLNSPNLSDKRKETLIQLKKVTGANLARLLQVQTQKARQFVDGAKQIASGQSKNVHFVYASGEGEFILRGSHLANHTTDSDYGPFGMVKRITNSMLAIQNILAKHNISLEDTGLEKINVNNYIKAFNNAVARIQQRALSDTGNSTKPNERKKRKKPLSNQDIINRIRGLLKPNLKDRLRVEYEADIRSLTNEQFRAAIAYANSYLVEDKSAIIQELFKAKKINEESARNLSKQKRAATKFSDKANNLLKQFTKEKIEKFSTFPQVNRVLTTLYNLRDQANAYDSSIISDVIKNINNAIKTVQKHAKTLSDDINDKDKGQIPNDKNKEQNKPSKSTEKPVEASKSEPEQSIEETEKTSEKPSEEPTQAPQLKSTRRLTKAQQEIQTRIKNLADKLDFNKISNELRNLIKNRMSILKEFKNKTLDNDIINKHISELLDKVAKKFRYAIPNNITLEEFKDKIKSIVSKNEIVNLLYEHFTNNKINDEQGNLFDDTQKDTTTEPINEKAFLDDSKKDKDKASTTDSKYLDKIKTTVKTLLDKYPVITNITAELASKARKEIAPFIKEVMSKTGITKEDIINAVNDIAKELLKIRNKYYDINKERSKELESIYKEYEKQRNNDFKGKFVYDDKLNNKKFVAYVNYKTGNIHINPNIIVWDNMFNNKDWLCPAIQKDGTQSTPIKTDFKTFKEFVTFVLEHEIQHTIYKQNQNESLGDYETRINNAAAKHLGIDISGIVSVEDNKSTTDTKPQLTNESSTQQTQPIQQNNKPITSFKGDYAFLSNFHKLNENVVFNNLSFDTVENAYQAAKFTDPDIQKQFVSITPTEAKSLAKKLQNKVRANWHTNNLNIMFNLLVQKFENNIDLASKLIDTNNAELIEGNNWGDTFFGQVNGKGENHLGKMLMEIRQAIQQGAIDTINVDIDMIEEYKNSLKPQQTETLQQPITNETIEADNAEIEQEQKPNNEQSPEEKVINDPLLNNVPEDVKDDAVEKLREEEKTSREKILEKSVSYYQYLWNIVNTKGVESLTEQEKEDFNALKELEDEIRETNPIFTDEEIYINAALEEASKDLTDTQKYENECADKGDTIAVLEVGEVDREKTDTWKVSDLIKNARGLSSEFSIQLNPGCKIAIDGKYNEKLTARTVERLQRVAPVIDTNTVDKDGKTINYPNLYFFKKKKTDIKDANDKVIGTIDKGPSIFDNSPHLRILYNITQKGNEINFEVNELAAKVAHLSMIEFLSQEDLVDFLNPKEDYRLARTFNQNEDTLSSAGLKELREIVNKQGVPISAIANKLGIIFLQNLGIIRNRETATTEFLEKTVAGLGLQLLLAYAEDIKPLFKISNFDLKEWITQQKKNAGDANASFEEHPLNGLKHKMTLIALNKATLKIYVDSAKNQFLGKRENPKSKVRSKDNFKEEYKLNEILNKSVPRTEPSLPPKVMYARHSQGVVRAADFQVRVVNKLWNTPYSIDLESVEYMESKRDALLKKYGYLTDVEIALLGYDDAAGAEGKNQSITREFDSLLEYATLQKQNKNNWYFSWFISKNGRIFPDSTTLNPQSSKQIQRFACLQKSVQRRFDPNGEKDAKIEAFAIAQAFDALKASNEEIQALGKAVNKLTLDEILQMRDDFVEKSEDEFSEIWSKKLNDIRDESDKKAGMQDFELGIENIGQCLNVFMHLIRKKQANGEKFKTWLAIENDSTTSGYFIRFMQMPLPEIIKKFGDKVGILQLDVENLTPEQIRQKIVEMHTLKRKGSGFYDIYQQMAKDTSLELHNYGTDYEKLFTTPLEGIKQSNFAKNNFHALYEAYEIFKESLPKPEVNDKGEVINISSEFRKLMKDPAMTFGYTAGAASIIRALADKLLKESISIYVDIENKGGLEKYKQITKLKKAKIDKYTAIYNTMKHLEQYLSLFGKDKNKSLHALLKEKSPSDIWLKINGKSITLNRFFTEMLTPVFGRAVWDSLSKSFSAYKSYIDGMNNMMGTMFTIFRKAYDKKYVELRKLHPNGIPLSEYRAMVESLRGYMPAMQLLYSNDSNKGMILAKMAKEMSNFTQVTTLAGLNEDNKMKLYYAYANVFNFAPPGKSGAVIPIHYGDGMMMALSLFKNINTPVHDAEVMSAFDNLEVTRDYNENGGILGNSLNMFGSIVDRLHDVVQLAEKEGLISIEDYDSVDGFGKSLNQKLPTFIKYMDELADKVSKAREEFYSKPIYIYNMDGIEGSGFIYRPTSEALANIAIKQKIREMIKKDERNRQGMDELDLRYKKKDQNATSHPYVDLIGDTKTILQAANVDHEARVKVFDALDNLNTIFGNKVENAEHMAWLRKLVGEKINPESIKDVVIAYTGKEYAAARITPSRRIDIGFDNKTGTMKDSVTGLHPYSTLSPAEAYAHELVHASYDYAFKMAEDTTLYAKEVAQLQNIRLLVSEKLDYTAFMPDTYDSNLQNVYENSAKSEWNRIFNNPDKTEGLSEFVAYAMTNEKFRKELSKIKFEDTLNNKTIKSGATLLDKIIAIAKAILDMFTGNAKLEGKSSWLDMLSKGLIPVNKQISINNHVENLITNIISANTKAERKLLLNNFTFLESTWKLLSSIISKGNNYLSGRLGKLTTYLDNPNNPYRFNVPLNSSFFNDIKSYSILALGAFLSKERRNIIVNNVLPNLLRFNQQGLIMSTIRDFNEPDLESSRLELLNLLTRNIDQGAKSEEGAVYLNLIEGFNKELKPEETNALTVAGLYTDLSSILEYDPDTNQSNINEIKKLLINKSYVSNEINKLNQKIKQEVNDKKLSMWYRNQALGLALFMVTGVGNEIQNLNARNIADCMLTKHPITASEDLVKDIDRLVTLYALSLTDNDNKQLLANLDDNGLVNYLHAHNEFKQKIKDGTEVKNPNDPTKVKVIHTLENIHSIKGYTKSLIDTSFDIKIAFENDEDILKKQGYKLISVLQNNKITDQTNLAIYRRNFASPNHRDGAAVISTGAHAIGSTLRDSANSLGLVIDNTGNSNAILWDTFKRRADVKANELYKLMISKELSAKDLIDKSSGYTPIVSPTTQLASDYRITMSHAHKKELLNMDTNGLNILSKMYATQYTKVNAPLRNQVLINFLIADMNENMDNNTHMDNQYHKYVLLSLKSNNKFIKEALPFIPKEFKKIMSKDKLWVREDWLGSLFGIPSISMADTKIVKAMPVLVRGAVSIAEYALKTIAYASKENILLKIPKVIISNIVSNLMYSVVNGANPIKVVKMTLDNFKAMRDFIDTQKLINKYEFKQRLRTITKSEQVKLNLLKNKLETNRLYPLIKEGFYQAILQDIKKSDLETIGKVQQFIKNNKIGQKIPSWMNNLARQLYLGEGTGFFNFMFQLTQYSDFVARATEYQLRMEKAPKKYEIVTTPNGKKRELTQDYKDYVEQVEIDILNAFINYDKPQAGLIQYLNDIGLVMFTKYATRIQHVIKKGLLKNPIGAFLFLITNSQFFHLDNIFEQNVFNKHWKNLFFSPWENFKNAIIPMPVQYASGIRHF